MFPAGYRNGPNESDPYGLSPQYWHVFAARLAFVVVFEVRNHHSRSTTITQIKNLNFSTSSLP